MISKLAGWLYDRRQRRCEHGPFTRWDEITMHYRDGTSALLTRRQCLRCGYQQEWSEVWPR